MELSIRGKKFAPGQVLIMGILNATPDSFYDGGRFFDPQAAIMHGLDLAAQGADIIDIGGESTRPGSARVSAQEELRRVVPVIKEIRSRNNEIPLSIDTYRSATAAAALEAGADMVNDVSGGMFDPEILAVAATASCPYVIMHMQKTPETMQQAPVYSPEGVVCDVKKFFTDRITAALKAGIKKENIILDPGLGFGKTLGQNIELINAIGEFAAFGFPLMAGISRKSMIGAITGREAGGRLAGSLAAAVNAVQKGATLLRVHDVAETRDAVAVTLALLKQTAKEAVK